MQTPNTRTKQELCNALGGLWNAVNANEALKTMLYTSDSDDLTFDSCARNGLGVICGLISDHTAKVANQLEELVSNLEQSEKEGKFNVADILRNGEQDND